MEDKREKALRTENIQSLVIKFAAPAILGMIINTVYNTVDSIFMGMLGTTALGAASVSFPFVLLTAAVATGFGIGGAAYMNRLLGQNDMIGASSALSTVVIIGFVTGVIYSVLGAVFTVKIAGLLGAENELMADTISYLRIIASGSVFLILANIFINHLRGEGSVLYALIVSAVGAVLNIILDPVFMFVLKMGVSGAAVATNVSLAISAGIGLYFYLTNRTVVKIKRAGISFRKELITDILKGGIPAFFQQCLIAVISVLFISIAAKFSPQVVAASGAYYKLYFLGMSVIVGLGFGSMPILGYNYGAKLHARVKETVFYTYSNAFAFSLLWAVVSIGFSNQIASLFSHDAQVLVPLSFGIRSLAMAQLFFSFYFINQTLFLALGKGMNAMLMTVLREGALPVISMLTLAYLFGVKGLMSSLTVTTALAMMVSMILVKPVLKELNANDNIITEKSPSKAS